MHVLFVHQNYPAQFGHIAHRLVSDLGWECTFLSLLPQGEENGVRRVQYCPKGGATDHNDPCTRTFENQIAHAHAVYQACEKNLHSAPDLIVGHSGFGSTIFLRELFDSPIINYFEYYYRARNSDIDFRPEFPAAQADYLRVRARNAMLLLDLDNCTAGYCPTSWQRSLFPNEYQPKLKVIFDGIDTDFWHRKKKRRRVIFGQEISETTRVVTYVSSGLEIMRGFDIFMQVARRIYQAYSDVIFVVVGAERTYYGDDARYIKHSTFKEHVLSQAHYDLRRFCFTGQIPAKQLVDILSLSDLHIYLSVPFVLSWSMLNALSCGCVVLASDVPPVAEVVRDGENGLLADFHDVDRLAELGLGVLRDPKAYREVARAGAVLVRERYDLERCLSRLITFFRRTITEPNTLSAINQECLNEAVV